MRIPQRVEPETDRLAEVIPIVAGERGGDLNDGLAMVGRERPHRDLGLQLRQPAALAHHLVDEGEGAVVAICLHIALMKDQLNPPAVARADQRLVAAERVRRNLVLGGAQHGHPAAVGPGESTGGNTKYVRSIDWVTGAFSRSRLTS